MPSRRNAICSEQVCFAPVLVRWQWALTQARTPFFADLARAAIRMARPAWSFVISRTIAVFARSEESAAE